MVISYKREGVHMIDVKAELLKLAKENFNAPGFVNGSFDQVVEPLIREAVQKTKTKIDDIAFEAGYPIIEEQLKIEFKKIWDSLFVASKPAPGGGDDVAELGAPV